MSDISEFVRQANSGTLARPSSQWRDPRDTLFNKQKPKDEKKEDGLAGFLRSMLPTAGGAGGALAGAAGGAALGSVVPIAGTAVGGLIGAILGGAGGSALGKVGQNAIEGEKDLGKDVAGEALLGGVTSTPIGAGLKLAKAGLQASKGALLQTGNVAAKQSVKEAGRMAIPKVATGLQEKATADIASTAAGATKLPFMQRIGKRMTESGSGLKADTSVGGVGKLGQQSEFMSKYTGTPRQQRVAMEKDMGDLSNQVDDILTNTPIKIQGKTVGDKIRSAGVDLADERFNDLDINPGVQKIIDRYAGKMDVLNDAKGVNDIVKNVNKLATKANNKLSMPNAPPLTAQETAALVVKRAGDDALSEIAEIKPLKQSMAQIFDVTPQVAKAGEKSIGLPMASGINAKAPVQGYKGILSRMGAKMQGTGVTPPLDVPPAVPLGLKTATDAAKGALPVAQGAGILGTIARQGLARQVAPVGQLEAPKEGEESQATDDTALADSSGVELGTGQDQTLEIQQRLQNAALQALAAGDSKGLDNIMGVANMIQSMNKTTAQKPMSAAASKTVAGANSGLQSLAQLQSIYTKSGVPKGTIVGGRGLFGGAGANILGTAEFDAAANNVADSMVRARTGAAATKEELDLYRGMLPQAFDSPEVANQKMKSVQDYFMSIANQTGSPGGDLQEMLGI